MAWPAISPSSAAYPAYRRSSTCRPSHCRMRRGDLVSRGIVGLETLIAGGDDYEILCTLPEDRVEAFVLAARDAGVATSSIGTVVAGSTMPKFLDGQGKEIALETALLQPLLKVTSVTSPSGHCYFHEKPIRVLPFDYRRAFSNALREGLLPETSSILDFESVRSPRGMKAWVLWRRENGYGNSEVVQRSKGFWFH